MAVSAAERRFLLDQVDRLAQNDLIRLWSTAEQLDDGSFFDFVLTGFPEIASTYYELAGQVAANWFEEAIPLPDYTPKPAELLPAQRLIESAQWALGGDGVQARDRLSGTLQRAVYDGARDTTAVNAEATGSRWIRVARANACEFCKLLATRLDENYTYRSKEAALGVVGRSVNLSDADRRAIASGQMTRQEALERRDRMAATYQIGSRKGQARTRRLRGARQYGAKYHDFCHCTAKEIPAGVDAAELLAQDDPQSAELVQQWSEEYEKAIANAGTSETKKVLSSWRASNKPVMFSGSNLTDLPLKTEDDLTLESRLSKRVGMKAVADREAALVNPNWKPHDEAPDAEYRNNCARCVTAYEMRRRGFDVTAGKSPDGTGIPSDELAKMWRRGSENGNYPNWRSIGDFSTNPQDHKKEIDKIVSEWPEGARGWVGVQWAHVYGGGGHVFVVENIGGKAVYLDPQIPLDVIKANVGSVENYFDRVSGASESKLLRVDELFPSNKVSELLEARQAE